jgi:hypothetical protein
VIATYNVSNRSLLEADVTGRGYMPMLQNAMLIASFIVIWPIFVTRLISLTGMQYLYKHIFAGIQTPIDKHTFHINIVSSLTWNFVILSYKTHCAWFLRWIYTAEFYSNLTHFCNKVNIFNIVVSNGNIIQTLSQTSSYDRKKHHNSYFIYLHTFHINIVSSLTWNFGILSYKAHCSWFFRWIYTAIDPQQMTCDEH